MAKTPPKITPKQQIKVAVGARVSTIRNAHKLLQTDFAKTIGTSKSRLSNIERGNAQLSTTDIVAILHHFPETDLAWLVFGRVSDEHAPSQDQFQAFINNLTTGARRIDAATGGHEYAHRLIAVHHDHLQLLQLYSILRRQNIDPSKPEADPICKPYLDSLSPTTEP